MSLARLQPKARRYLLSALIPRQERKHALIIGQAVRLAHTLSAGMAGILPQTSLVYEANKLVLFLPKRLEALDGETLRRRLRIVAKELGVAPEVQNRAEAGSCKDFALSLAYGASQRRRLVNVGNFLKCPMCS